MKGVLIGILVIAVLIGMLCVLSYGTLHTVNFWKGGTGLMQVLFSDAAYATIREAPKMIVAKPQTSLDTYMWENGGYLPVLEEQMGAVLVYRNGNGEVKIHYSVNGYFAKWQWIE